MAEDNHAMSGESRSTHRFTTEDVGGDVLNEGDRISKNLVARTPGQLGETIKPVHPEGNEPPKTQFVAVTEIDRYDDVHSAILLDPDAEMFVRASRHGNNQAMTQAEADWTVREIGSKITVKDADVDNWGESEPAENDIDWMQEWIDVVFGDIRAGYLQEYADRRSLNGTTLTMNDELAGHKGTAKIKLEGGQ